MTMIRKLVRATVNVLGEDEVEVVMSTAALARDGHILLPQGCRIDNYRANPIVLWSHDPDKPIGNAENISIEPEQIRACIKFAPLGISRKADEVRGLMKSGVVRAVSVGFDPIDGEPLDPRRPKGGQRFTDWELLELSAVSVPSDTGAMVTNRSIGDETMADDTDNSDQGVATPKPATKTRVAKPSQGRVAVVFGERGVYQVADLCYMFESLGYKVDVAKYEAAIEGDGSQVPAMLAGVLHDLGDAILAMAQEEIAEALAGYDCEPEEDDTDVVLVVEERAHIRDAKSPIVRAFRRGLAQAKLRAGKTLSSETVRCLRDAKALHEEGIGLHRSAMRKHKDGISAIDDMLNRAGASESDGGSGETAPAADATAADDTDSEKRDVSDFQRRQADVAALTIVE